MTAGKIADGAITSSKFDSSATAPNATKLGGIDIVVVSQSTTLPPNSSTVVTITCPADRVAIHTSDALDRSVGFGDPDYDCSSIRQALANSSSSQAAAATASLSCLGKDYPDVDFR